MIERGEITAALSFVAILAFFLFLASMLGGCEGRCGSSACIGIDPCDVLECPEPPPEEEPEEERTITLTRSEYHDLLVRVCTYCQASVVCEDSEDSTDECDADVPPGHLAKHCPNVRGNHD